MKNIAVICAIVFAIFGFTVKAATADVERLEKLTNTITDRIKKIEADASSGAYKTYDALNKAEQELNLSMRQLKKVQGMLATAAQREVPGVSGIDAIETKITDSANAVKSAVDNGSVAQADPNNNTDKVSKCEYAFQILTQDLTCEGAGSLASATIAGSFGSACTLALGAIGLGPFAALPCTYGAYKIGQIADQKCQAGLPTGLYTAIQPQVKQFCANF